MGAAIPTVHQVLDDLKVEEQEQHDHVERPDPADTAHHELSGGAPVHDLVAVGKRDDESAQHEEEIDEQVAVPEKRLGVKMTENRKMHQSDKERTDTTPTVESMKTQRCLHGSNDR